MTRHRITHVPRADRPLTHTVTGLEPTHGATAQHAFTESPALARRSCATPPMARAATIAVPPATDLDAIRGTAAPHNLTETLAVAR
ncbi:hypothetical protein NDR87_18035 [Nocardia sp. CDC159]|uniref:Uncharacterized protein n=1 Tax=Nocardia pulmonis TaxID=2951408 RepID=A0A9X2IX85_9NOCA|nr:MULTISPECIES: hypothetical protein [Nocardia]MCM6775762.1 hypothetical protein [Nocardia pulmonis]MCM6788262.1 hypothetical protein [Nocardia sp. CDC159]